MNDPVDTSSPPSSAPDTRQRLLDAAGEIFAQRGFRDATIREICQRAGANIAAVNYYFRDKEGLYAAVIQYTHAFAVEKYDVAASHGPAGDGAPEQALRGFIRAFMDRLYDAGRPAWHGRLPAREMVDPTGALDELVQRFVRPQAGVLMDIVRTLLGPLAAEDDVRLCAMSVVGQCLHYHHSRPVITRLFPDFAYHPNDVARLADHIADFSLAGIAAIRARIRPGRHGDLA